jgi:transcriptional regulator of arginine metabolism
LKVKKMSKSQRQHLLAKILEEQAVSSQVKLVGLLKTEGIDVTQATLSRDLEELGAVKVRVPVGDSVYAIPDNPTERVLPIDYLRRVLGEWLMEVSVSNNIVVLRTPPGSAHVVASAVDRAGLSEIIGTVAGDDTVLLVTAPNTTGEEVSKRLKDLAGIEPTNSE